jgi:hypothetical protein
MHMLFENPIAHPSVMFRKKLALFPNGYNTKYNSIEDWDLWSRLIKITKFANLPDFLLHYRTHFNNQTFLKSKILKKHKISIMHKMFSDHNLPFNPSYFDEGFLISNNNFDEIYSYFNELKKINFDRRLFLTHDFNQYLQKLLNSKLLKGNSDYIKLFIKYLRFRLAPLSPLDNIRFSVRFFLIALLAHFKP